MQTKLLNECDFYVANISEITKLIINNDPIVNAELLDMAKKIKNFMLPINNFWLKKDMVYINPYINREDILRYLELKGEDLNSNKVKENFSQRWSVGPDNKKIRKIEYWEDLNINETDTYE